MGIYNAHLLEYLDKLHLPIWLESSLQIKQAGGMQRGKTDKVDAQRIAEYAYRFRDKTRLWQPPRPIIRQLAFLSAARQRVIQVYNQLAGPLDEQDTFVSSTMQKQVRHSCKASLAALEKDRKALDKQIETLIRKMNIFSHRCYPILAQMQNELLVILGVDAKESNTSLVLIDSYLMGSGADINVSSIWIDHWKSYRLPFHMN